MSSTYFHPSCYRWLFFRRYPDQWQQPSPVACPTRGDVSESFRIVETCFLLLLVSKWRERVAYCGLLTGGKWAMLVTFMLCEKAGWHSISAGCSLVMLMSTCWTLLSCLASFCFLCWQFWLDSYEISFSSSSFSFSVFRFTLLPEFVIQARSFFNQGRNDRFRTGHRVLFNFPNLAEAIVWERKE